MAGSFSVKSGKGRRERPERTGDYCPPEAGPGGLSQKGPGQCERKVEDFRGGLDELVDRREMTVSKLLD